ncbi:DNA polymerase zeta catalytic subunit [Clonorchis sinensis]|uniref:DNA polymerase zeta catalytic subunit n=1 Tax=Clonorchis sinensis TaxID=79923 RepID=A0A8T1N101_CLOSI|nr:DNA polymerase zeta catalytic subunit [Clonorchis sinensis]
MTPEEPILCIKLFYLDYYFSKPLTDIDNSYSDLRGSYASKLPVIRLYGTTPSGQKVCANVHGYLPHLFVELPERVDSASPQCDFVRAFCTSLEKAIRSRTRDFAADDMLVFGATLVQGCSIYGFRPREGAFLKVYLLDPSLLIPCAEVLAGGHVMDRHFEALEVHVPFLLKFCVDYNLYGMNYMRAKYFRARGDKSVCVDTTVCSSVDGTYLCYPATHVGDQLLPSDEAPRHTSTQVEVDISVQDILNRAELAGCSGLNPGLEAMWSEERARRISNQFGSELPETPTPDELLPLTRDGSFPMSARERALRDRWTQLIARLGGESIPSISDDFIARWLEQSHNEDEEREPTQTPPPLMEFSSAESGQSRAIRLNSSSTQDALSKTSVDELKRLASVTEDADASLMFPDKELPWGFLKCSLEWSEAARSSLHGSSVFSQLSVRSSQEARELGSSHRSKVASNESQDLANSPLSVSDHDTLRIVDSPRSEHTFLDDEGAEATLLSCATRSAIQYVLCHGSNGDDFVLEQNDADTIKHLVAANEEGICVADEVIPDSDDSGDVQEREQTLNILPPPNFGSGTCLERIEESDEEFHPPEDPDGELFFGPLSPWSFHSDAGDEPVPTQSEHLTFSPSQSLFDSLPLEEHEGQMEECVQKAPKEPRISQLDGTEDDSESTQGDVRPERGRRRRLGMRLTTSRTNIRSSKASGSELSLVSPTTLHQQGTEVQSSSSGTPSNTSAHASPAAKQADDAVTQFTPRPVDKLNISPVVLMEKLNPALLHSPQSEPFSDLHLNRLSPRDEFEDLIIPISPISQIETTPVPSGIQSFHPLDDALSLTTLDEPLSFTATPGHLTLYSQTQYSPTPGSSSFPTPQMELDPLPIPVPIYPETPLWRPSIPPPSVSSVNRWLQKCSTPLLPGSSDITPVHHDVENSSNSSTDSEIVLNITTNPNPQEGLISVNSASQDDSVSPGQPSNSTQPHDISLTARRSSVTSVSMMYQAASQRCFLPVQTDHTTVASLELHCRSRLVNVRGRPNTVDSSQNSARSQTNAPMCRGLLPNAKLDPIILACLTFRVPSTSREKSSHSRKNLFVLVNTTEMPKLDTTNASTFKWPGPFRLALTSYLNGPSLAKDAAINSSVSKAASFKQNTGSSRTVRARFIWCESEWNLLSWVVYFLQWYDPDLLIGYDVERYSWGYLVQRASYLNRPHYPRELSRLAPGMTFDRLNFFFCY